MSSEIRAEVVEALMQALLEHDFSKLKALEHATDAERQAALDGVGTVFELRYDDDESTKTIRLANLLRDAAEPDDDWDQLWAKLTPTNRDELVELFDILPPPLEERVKVWMDTRGN